jgi:hypothetical protein
VDLEAAQREKAMALGVPTKLIRSPDEVAALRKQKADAAQAAQAQAQNQQMAGMAGEAMIKSAMPAAA